MAAGGTHEAPAGRGSSGGSLSLLSRSWVEWPQVAISLNPVKGLSDEYQWFCDLALARREPGKRSVTVVSWRIRNEGRPIRGREAILFEVGGPLYFEQSRRFADVVDEVLLFVRGALPIAVSPGICKPLLLSEARRSERESGERLDRTDAFLLREKSRWVDLALLRRRAGAPAFSGLSDRPDSRVVEALVRFDALAGALAIDRSMTVPQLLDWQDTLKGT